MTPHRPPTLLLDADRHVRRGVAIVIVALTISSGVFPFVLFRITRNLTRAHDYNSNSRRAVTAAIPSVDAWIAQVHGARQGIAPGPDERRFGTEAVMRGYFEAANATRTRLDSLQAADGTSEFAGPLANLDKDWQAVETARRAGWATPQMEAALVAVRADFDGLRLRYGESETSAFVNLRVAQQRGLLASIVFAVLVVASGVVVFRRGLRGIGKAIESANTLLSDVARSEARLVDAQARAHLGSWEYEIATGKRIWSDENYRIHGYVPRTINPDQDMWLRTVHPDDRERAHTSMQGAIRTGTPLDLQFRLRLADGTLRYVHSKGDIERDERGTPIRMMGTLLDVTESHRAAEALAAQDTRFQFLISRSTDLIILLGGDGILRYISPPFEHMLGFRIDDWIGRPLTDLVWPPDLDEAGATITRGLATPRQPIAFQFRVRHRDGTFRWIEGTGTNYTDDPAMSGLVINAHDATERIAAEASLRTKDAAISTALTAIAIADAKGIITYVNPAFVRLWGYADAGEAIGKPALGLVDTTAAAQITNQIVRGGSWQGEIMALRRNGSVVPALLSASSIAAADGTVVSMMCSFLDLTEPKRLEAHLLQSQKIELVGQLAGGVAHDFNNLLTIMRGHVSLALAQDDLPDTARVRLLEIEKAAESGAVVTRKLLTFARHQVIDPKVLRVGDVVAGIEEMLRRLLGESVELRVTLADTWHVRADAGQVEQVIINCVVNAVDAMPEGGTLAVATADVTLDDAYVQAHPASARGDYVMVSVSDEGLGMTPEVLAHIFEPFFTTKPQGRGTGLGLATVHGVLKQGGGHIDIESAPGRGTTIRMYLPRSREEEAVVRPAAPPGIPVGNGETVVVVEDEEAIRELSQTMLERLGYRVLEFSGGTEALAAVAATSEKVDLLLTDVVLGGMSGRVLAERMRQLRPGLRVLFTSGYTEDVIVRHGVASGSIAFMAKPYSMTTLAKRVRATLDASPDPGPVTTGSR